MRRSRHTYTTYSTSQFKGRIKDLLEPLAAVRYQQGLLLGRMGSLGFPLQRQAALNAMTEETIKSSALAGEAINAETVRSRFARRLGVPIAEVTASDRNVDGIVQILMDATENYSRVVTEERLFAWHTSLFSDEFSELAKIRTAAWREEKMQGIFRQEGNENCQFEALSARPVKQEMKVFLSWFNDTDEIPPLIKTGLAHLNILTIRPFEDGNGRIARALTELCLARLERSSQRFYSLSAEILEEQMAYYENVGNAQRGELAVTEWLLWFLNCLRRAIEKANEVTNAVLERDAFWQCLSGGSAQVTERQKELINRLLDGLEGKLTTERWARIKNISHDSALRDIQSLIEKGILKQNTGRTKGAAYSLAVKYKFN